MRIITTIKNWQVEAFQLGRPSKYFLAQSPGGAGKSLVQVLLGQADIEYTSNKQLNLVPKNHIHHGFYDEECIEVQLPGQNNRFMISDELSEATDDILDIRAIMR